MSKKISISIPTPCHENWDGMTPSEKGRFCGSCQKEVVDFTNMTDGEVYKFFANNIGKSVCGHTLSTQLEVAYTAPPSMQKRKPWWWSAAAAILVFFTKADAKAQTKPATGQGVTTAKPELLGKIDYQPVETTAKGKVADENGNPVLHAIVKVKGTKRTTVTDAAGNFSMPVKNGDILQVSAAGFELLEMIVKDNRQEIKIILPQKETRLMGEIAYVPPTIKIKGDVVDESGNPVPFASVAIKGTKKGAAADANGNFSLTITGNTVLQVSAVGYKIKEQVIEATDKPIKIQLQVDKKMLDGQAIITVGGIGISDDSYVAPDVSKYVAQIAVTDGSTGKALPKVQLSITKNYETKEEKTDSKGLYKIKKIKEWETVRVTATATGYKPQTLTIKGSSFKRYKQTMYMALEKMPVEVIAKKVETVRGDTVIVPMPTKKIEPTVVNTVDCAKALSGVVGGLIVTSSSQIQKPTIKQRVKKVFTIPSKITIAPNPVAPGGTLALQIKGFEKKQVIISVVSQGGQVVQQQTIYIPVQQFGFQWQVAATVSAGIYIVRVASAEGSTHSQTKLVVQ